MHAIAEFIKYIAIFHLCILKFVHLRYDRGANNIGSKRLSSIALAYALSRPAVGSINPRGLVRR